ncbi:unnamed protein product, partial [Rotaria magnacalcarata]
AKPNPYAVQSLKHVMEVQREFWPSIAQYKNLISMSHEQAISS